MLTARRGKGHSIYAQILKNWRVDLLLNNSALFLSSEQNVHSFYCRLCNQAIINIWWRSDDKFNILSHLSTRRLPLHWLSVYWFCPRSSFISSICEWILRAGEKVKSRYYFINPVVCIPSHQYKCMDCLFAIIILPGMGKKWWGLGNKHTFRTHTLNIMFGDLIHKL